MVNYYISFTVIITLSTKFLFEVQLKYPSPPPRFYLLERMSRERGERREREKQTPWWSGNLRQSLSVGPWNHDSCWKQTLNRGAREVPALMELSLVLSKLMGVHSLCSPPFQHIFLITNLTYRDFGSHLSLPPFDSQICLLTCLPYTLAETELLLVFWIHACCSMTNVAPREHSVCWETAEVSLPVWSSPWPLCSSIGTKDHFLCVLLLLLGFYLFKSSLRAPVWSSNSQLQDQELHAFQLSQPGAPLRFLSAVLIVSWCTNSCIIVSLVRSESVASDFQY